MRKMLTALTLLFFTATAHADPVRITFLGDSLVHGYGLEQGDGLVPQLQQWLDQQGADVVLANAGVSGDTTSGGAARVAWTMADQPQGLIVLLGGNDMMRGIPPEQARSNLDLILSEGAKAGAALMLVGVTAPGNFGPDYKAGYDALYPDLAAAHGALLFANIFKGISDKVGGDPGAAQQFMLPDGIHPNPEGVALNVAELGPVVLQLVARVQAR